jgi:hypothetical protein
VLRAAKHVALIVAYVAVAIVWLYALDGLAWALAFAAFNFAVGVAGRSWWYVVLPAVLGPLAINTESSGDAGAGWAFALFFAAPLGACLIALGAAAVRVVQRTPLRVRRSDDAPGQ